MLITGAIDCTTASRLATLCSLEMRWRTIVAGYRRKHSRAMSTTGMAVSSSTPVANLEGIVYLPCSHNPAPHMYGICGILPCRVMTDGIRARMRERREGADRHD